ncbi:MAG: (2Fe-2S)-binding protein [Methylococcaceae bacterium]|nr:(2Fe-2S)-binding protein [Methylococcaceae bacterium]
MFKQLPGDKVGNVEIILNGQPLQVVQGISVAAAVLSNHQRFTRTTPISGSQRAPFCMMGVCYDCLMVINGKANQRACATIVEEGMYIDNQQGVGPAMENPGSE